MAKILKNVTVSSITITDTGISIPASPATYTIPPQDYLLWAASSNIITRIGSGDIVVNDGSSDLSISDGTDHIKGFLPRKIIGGTDGTTIGNVLDRLKVDAQVTAISDAATSSAILKQADMNVAAKTETDLTGLTYTVPAGKRFKLVAFNASYTANFPIFVRLKKQTGGVGAFVQLYRIALGQHPQDSLNFQISNPLGVNLGVGGDVFKVTFEAALIKGNIWAAISGVEFNV